MKPLSPVILSAAETARAARRFTRRGVIRAGLGVAVSSATSIGPWYVKDALSSSGECRVFIWSGYLPQPFIERFEGSTGIKLKITEAGSNEQFINKLKSTQGRGFDIITPTMMRADQWRHLGLLQAWEPEKLPMDNLEPRFLRASERDWTWDYGLYHLPHLWGTEALAYQTEHYQASYGQLSLGDLWAPEVEGKIMGRPHSLMAGIGRYLASQGKLAPFEEAYRDEDTARSIWSEVTKFAIERKDWVRQFWNDAKTQKEGFLRNGVVLGQTWDGPIIEMKNEGEPVNYMAPREGAFAWMDGFSMPIGATNIDQAYALIAACYDANNAGIQASLSGYNATVKGADAYISSTAKKAFQEAYPDDALEKLWWWPAEPQWYADIRDEYRDAFLAA